MNDARGARTTERIGLLARLKQQAQEFTPEAYKAELDWQLEVAGNKDRETDFKGDLLGIDKLRVLGFMTPNSPLVHIVHSAKTFFKVGGPTELMRKPIGFVGDRDADENHPAPITLPAQNVCNGQRSRSR